MQQKMKLFFVCADFVETQIPDENESISTFFMKSSACPKSPNSFYELECCGGMYKIGIKSFLHLIKRILPINQSHSLWQLDFKS